MNYLNFYKIKKLKMMFQLDILLKYYLYFMKNDNAKYTIIINNNFYIS